ncbi:hypothetical protein [Rhizobium sp. CC-YZS058]|uniref:hypothetical protein n=1 Tax=Rhizobium sp. CC-YZS058 TaxID=3042153 RepID=UPI002B054F26|nr:hypothetical protein [Rhizobium sp. CC-YZS058]MEA3535436.1 hypothetical protein [Rhizobium sp. CC-YZS058]
MALCIVLLAWMVLREEVEAEPFVSLAQRIESGKTVDPNYVIDLADTVLAFPQDGRCASQTVKAGLTILLKRLDTLDPKAQAPAFFEALAQTRAYVDHALACTPADGNLWLRRAMISLAEGRNPELVRADMERSHRFAPAEQKVLGGRFAVWNRLPITELSRSTPVLLADLKVICRSPDFMIKLPKASASLERFLDAQAQRTKQTVQTKPVAKVRRNDQTGRKEGPGLWCEQLSLPN